MTTAAPGWYPDPSGNGGQRWWDGNAWGDTAQPAYTAASLRAPEGAKTDTPWIWLIIVLPLLTFIPLFFIDWGGMFDIDPDDPTSSSRAMMSVFVSPGYLLAVLGGWLVYGLSVFFAYRDFKALESAGVPRPFHWAFAFISSYVYPIGRSVVVKRRTGRDGGTLAGSIIALVLIFVLTIALMVIMMTQMMNSLSTLYPYGY